MNGETGTVVKVLDIQPPIKRGTDAKSEQDYQDNLKKYQEEQALGIKKKIYFLSESPIEVKGEMFIEKLIWGLKTKEVTLKVGDRISVKGKIYQIKDGERGFNKNSLVEVLSSKK